MKGEPAILVHSSSATHGRPWEGGAHSVQPINRAHSDLVKYSIRDSVYEMVLYVLRGFANSAVNVIRGRFVTNQSIAHSLPQKSPTKIGTDLCE